MAYSYKTRIKKANKISDCSSEWLIIAQDKKLKNYSYQNID
jgi:hypothetical protein